MVRTFQKIFLIFVFSFASNWSHAQDQQNFSLNGMTGGSQKIELSDPEAIKDLKAYIEKEKSLISERNECKQNKDEKQERQECLCNRGKQYEHFGELIMQTLIKHETWDMAVLTWDENGKKKRRFALFNPHVAEFENKCWREANGSYTAIYDNELPEIRVTEPASVKELAQLNRYMEKARKIEPACPWDDKNSLDINERDACICKSEDKFKYLKAMINGVIKRHPDWEFKTIGFLVGRNSYGVSLLNMRRTMQRYIDRCKK